MLRILSLLGLVSVLGVFVFLIFNAGKRSFLWLKTMVPGMPSVPFWSCYALSILAIFVVYILSRVPNMALPREFLAFSHYALGVAVYFLMLVNVVHLCSFLVQLVSGGKLGGHGVLLWTGWGTFLLLAAVCTYGFLHAKIIQVQEYSVSISAKESEVSSLRVVLLSDVHLGYITDEAYVARLVEAINSQGADFVCIAGDLFDGDVTSLDDREAIAGLFGSIESRYGVYACLGNHDAGAGYEEMVAFCQEAGIVLLEDETAVVEDVLVISGRRDLSPIGNQGATREEFAETAQMQTLPTIVLDHQPSSVSDYRAPVDLVLSGHTHKGQMFPFGLVTNAIFEVDYGYYETAAGVSVIVSSGAGTWGPPMRVASDSEIVSILLDFS